MSPSAASGCAARPCRPASASPDRDSRCAEPGARRSSRRRLPPSGRSPPSPSGARPQSRSSRATHPRRRSSQEARERLIISSVIGASLGSGWSSQPDPSRRPPMATSREDARPLQRCGRRADGRLRYPGTYTYTTSWNTTDAAMEKLFKGGGKEGSIQGAQRLLEQIDKGEFELPNSISREMLEAYRDIALSAIARGRDRIGVQALRLKEIDRMLWR